MTPREVVPAKHHGAVARGCGRAQRLIGSGFLDIMRDMAPESIGHIEMITGQARSQPKSEETQ